jgi:hypothetical protein
MDKVTNVSTIGLDFAKYVFQVHGVDKTGQVAVRRQLRRSDMIKFFTKFPPCVVGMEACGSAHYWARELTKLGHSVRLIPASAVKPYVKRGKKNDATDAAAICEAVGRPYNAPFHKRSDISSAISNAGHILDFLPAYSPDLNPIERKWAHAKSIRKKISCSISKLFNFESFYLA